MNEWITRRSDEEALAGQSTPQESARGFNSTSVDSQYQRDRARIIHSASFRALQSKTQVLGLGESDFYRTRLTHSLEVAQIGSGICEWLRNKPDNPPGPELEQWIPSLSLIEAICLAHDIGHSPFGHGGEVALNYMMKDHGGFEANGQTLRIVSRLGEYSPSNGLDLTRRTQLGTIKYPVFYSDVVNYVTNDPGKDNKRRDDQDHPSNPHRNIDHWAPPKCLYDSDRDTLAWITEPFDSADTKRLLSYSESKSKSDSQRRQPTSGHGRSQFKSFDTSIMEIADDIAYGVHDLEDALALGLLDLTSWKTTVSDALQQWPDNPITRDLEFYHRELFSNENRNRKHAISKLVGYFIRNIHVTEDPSFNHPMLRYQAAMKTEAYEILKCLKGFVMDKVILRPELQALQYKGQQVIINLFEIFAENPKRLLPEDVYRAYCSGDDNSEPIGVRAIGDFISGMTDVSAGKLYHKLLTPTAGSIFDRT